ncbi:hypothetical protein [Sporichthya polymorpha]|uniref:hypothetical protein n=1 Tax=Sporichthya polymorpha TaxID=35751 RepID=UPI00037186E4|nr:hypothetical protein [Sporichthya polymorpha]
MPGFIQTVTYTTSRIDEVRRLGEELRDRRVAAGDGPKPVQISICADRDVPNRYTTIIEFASFEEAMESSNHPETHEFAQQMHKLCDGPPAFSNLDVLDQMRP